MARITIELNTEDAADVPLLVALARPFMPEMAVDYDQRGVPVVVEVEPAAEEKPRRGRPRKTDALPREPIGTDLGAEDVVTMPKSSSGIPEQTDAGALSSLLDDAEADAPAPTITAADVRAAMQAHMDKHNDGAKTQALLKAHGAGAASFKQIAEEHYGAVHAALVADM